MKAVIYARYSSDSQREESIEGQIRECTSFAEKNGITILRHYIDRAYSAKTDNRPDFQEMIKDSGKKLFDMVIVWKLDRFARNRYDSARYKAQLKRNGVKVVSATEVISEGAEGIILESVLEGYAEYYSADLSEKVIRGRTENALKCKFNGGTLPIGYVIDEEQHFQIDPLTAPFVLDVFKKYDKGATMKELRDWLNENGIRNKLGKPLNFNSIQHMLSNRRYIGEYKYRDIVVPDGIPAIVPQDLFDRVQEKLAQNRKAPARHKAEDDYLLTTKLFCGYCGAYLCGESGKSRNGTIHHYYKCVSVKKKRTDCKKKPVRKQWLEDLVVNEVMKVVMDDKAIEAIVSMVMDLQDRENTSLPLYEQQLREAETGIQNLLNAIQQGILTKSTKSRLEELEAAKEDLEIKIANEKIAKPRISPEFVTFWLHKFRKLDVRQQSHRKMLIDAFVNAIYLYDDKLVLTFNYKDGTRTITLDDVKEAAKANTGSDLDCRGAPVSPCPLWDGGIFLLRRGQIMLSVRKAGKNCVGRRNLAGEIQVRVNIGCSGNIAVSQPLLNFFQANSVGIQKTCAAVSKIVETDLFQIVLGKQDIKMLGDEIGLHQFSQGIHIDIFQVIIAVAISAYLAVDLLLGFNLPQQSLEWWNQRKCPAAGFCFRRILLDNRVLPVHLDFHHCVLDGEGLSFKVDGIPFKSHNFTAPEAVERSQNNGQFQRVSPRHGKQLVQFFLIVDCRLVAYLPGLLYPICRIGFDESNLERILKTLAHIGVSADHRCGRQACIQHALIIILNVFRMPLQILNRTIPGFEERDDTLFHICHIGRVGGGFNLTAHHVKPILNEIRKQDGRLIVAGMHLFGGIAFQPAKFHRIGKASYENPVMIKQFIDGRLIGHPLIPEVFCQFFCGNCRNRPGMLLEKWDNAVFDRIGRIGVLSCRQSNCFILEPLERKHIEAHLCIFPEIFRIKFFPRFQKHCLCAFLVSFHRQACADGFCFSFSLVILPVQNHLVITILFSQVSCNHCILLNWCSAIHLPMIRANYTMTGSQQQG